MPLPFLAVALGVTAGALGVGGHLSAKETNEKAQRIAGEAKELYEDAKASLEATQEDTKQVLNRLGYAKKDVLNREMKQFRKNYEKIKDISFRESVGLNELSKFTIEEQDLIQIQQMTDIYDSAFGSGVTGAAAGAVIGLAATGSLSLVTGGLTTAGSLLAIGEFSAAAGMAGSALSLGAAMTPLSAIAAPVVLFTGISASMKADENLEKARVMYAEAEKASEKMQVSETLYRAISQRSDMFHGLLTELNGMFSECTQLLEGVVRKKEGFFKKKLKTEDFTNDELKLLAVTGALAKAVKTVIDTPILQKDGTLSEESQTTCDQMQQSLPDFSQSVKEVKSINYNAKPVPIKNKTQMEKGAKQTTAKGGNILEIVGGLIMWILCIWVILAGICLIAAGSIIAGVIWIYAGYTICPKRQTAMGGMRRVLWMFALMVIGTIFV